jgi:hypothetical protein
VNARCVPGSQSPRPRHRHTAGKQDAEKAKKIIAARRQHDRDRVAGLEGVLDPAAIAETYYQCK